MFVHNSHVSKDCLKWRCICNKCTVQYKPGYSCIGSLQCETYLTLIKKAFRASLLCLVNAAFAWSSVLFIDTSPLANWKSATLSVNHCECALIEKDWWKDSNAFACSHLSEAALFLQRLKVVPSYIITSYLAGDYFQARSNIITVRQQSSLIITPEREYSSSPYRLRKSQLFTFPQS